MTEAMIVEAVKSAGSANPAVSAANAAQAPSAVADPAAVERFDAAMAPDPVPFASEVSAAWRSAQENNQGILHRIKALCEMKSQGNVAAAELVELQYEVMNLAFQQEVVTKVAEKSSSAIQTLVRNQ